MDLNLKIIKDLYLKTSIVLLALSVILFIPLYFFYGFFKSLSCSIGCFVIFLNVFGISLIAKFSENKTKINRERVIFSILLFIGKLFFILILIFALIKFKLVDNTMFIVGLSIGFLIFFIANLVFLPLKIYKQEQASNESC